MWRLTLTERATGRPGRTFTKTIDEDEEIVLVRSEHRSVNTIITARAHRTLDHEIGQRDTRTMHTSINLSRSILMFVAALAIAIPGCGDDGPSSNIGNGGNGGDDGNGGDGGNGGDDGDGGNGGDDGDADVTCDSYCAAIMTNCEGLAQYASEDDCKAFCEHLPEGTAGDTSGNSLACRAHHASLAEAEPETHCVHAGPSGAGVCGAAIDAFCEVAPAVCPDVYADKDACDTAAEAFDADAAYEGPASTGDTLACRLFHLTAASTDAATHCQHIAETSATCSN